MQPAPHKAPGGCGEAWGAPWGLSAPLASAGEVNITVSAEALTSTELCGNQLPMVPVRGHVDTVIKSLLVQVRGVMEEGSGMGLGTGSKHPLGGIGSTPRHEPGRQM